MANRNTSAGFGLISAGTSWFNTSYWRTRQILHRSRITHTDSVPRHCTVSLKDGYVITCASGYYGNTFAIGVLNGIFYNASTTLKPTWANWYNQPITPANSENLQRFVIRQSISTFCWISFGYSLQ